MHTTDTRNSRFTAPTHAQPVVNFRNVSRSFGEGDAAVTALNNVNIGLQPQAFTAVMGPSGAGKSTFVNLAAGLDRPTSGEIDLAGTRIDNLNDDQLARYRSHQAGFIFQAFNLVQSMTAAENIELPFHLRGQKITSDGKNWIGHIVESLGISELLDRRPHSMSGGQQQRVAIARALASRPTVIFADEPTGALDSRTSRNVLTLLNTAVAEYRQTVIMVTHDSVAASYADRLLVIADGRVVGNHSRKSASHIADMMVNLEAQK